MADELRRDLIAGLTVGAISLSQAMAYTLVAGVDPRFGSNSAIVVAAVASNFGSSSHFVNGPTRAISLLVFNYSLEDFISGMHGSRRSPRVARRQSEN